MIATPLTLPHGPAWSNRLALAPLTNTQSHPDGTLGEEEYAWLVRRARGGFGLTMTCAAHVSPEGQAFPGQLGIWDDRHLPGLTRLADGLRTAGSVSSVQLHHGGRRALAELSGRPVVAPFDDPGTGARALTTEEVHRAVDDFVAGAVRAERAGFDGVELHGAHGYLLCQFLDGRNNQRTDGYGGSLEERARPTLEVIEGIRAATGPDLQLGIRLTPERNGVVLAEARELLGMLLAAGRLDYVELSMWDVFKRPYEDAYDGLLLDHFTDLPRGATRLGVAGHVRDAAGAAWCLEHGADFVSIGTGAIVDPDFATHALADPAYAAPELPTTPAHLASVDVSPAFVDYLAARDGFVA